MTKEDFLIKYSADKHANGKQWIMAMMQEYADQETKLLRDMLIKILNQYEQAGTIGPKTYLEAVKLIQPKDHNSCA